MKEQLKIEKNKIYVTANNEFVKILYYNPSEPWGIRGIFLTGDIVGEIEYWSEEREGVILSKDMELYDFRLVQKLDENLYPEYYI